MSAHGISPAWMVDSDGLPDSFFRAYLAIDAECTLNQDPDIVPSEIMIFLTECDIQADKNDLSVRFAMSLSCFAKII